MRANVALPTLLFALCVNLLASSGANASPAYGGARVIAVRAETQLARGFQLHAPDVIATAAGARIHGSVCRIAQTPLNSPQSVAIEQMDSGGHVVATTRVRLNATLSGRHGFRCATYDARIDGAAVDTFRASLVR